MDLLDQYRNVKLSDGNEAETRLKVIDRIIYDILGWTDDDVSVEDHVTEDKKTTYTDYIIKTANTSIVIEAKRVGVAFDIEFCKQRVLLNKAFLKGELEKAIVQVRDYCRKNSIPFGVVTNGNQWIIFPGNRTDNVPFHKSTAIVFSSLESILEKDLELFKHLLSRGSVLQDILSIELLGRKTDQIEARRLYNFSNLHSTKVRNPIYPLIEDAINSSFRDLTDLQDPKLIKKCYVTSPDRTKFDAKLKIQISKRANIFSSKPLKPMKKSDRLTVGKIIENATAKNRPLAALILGSVGAGKTTFLNYLKNISCHDLFSSVSPFSPHWINLDFREHEASSNISTFIYDSLFTYINENKSLSDFDKVLKNCYKNEIKTLKIGPLKLLAKNKDIFEMKISEMIYKEYQEKNPYVDKILKYISTQASIFMVIDNVDQYKSDQKQSEIFSEAMAISHKLRLNLIICMRQTTFTKHKGTPLFDAFDYEAIEIDPPDVDAVLSKRFFITKQILENKKGTFTALNDARFEVDNLSIFIDIVQQSVLDTQVSSYIKNFATGDLRLALRMTRSFLERGYTDPAQAITKYKLQGRYQMPVHEALRSIILGRNNIYTEASCVLGNPFDAYLNKTSSQLLRFFIINALVITSNTLDFEKINGEDIIDICKNIGFSKEDVLKVLSDLCELRYLQTYNYSDSDQFSYYLPTRLSAIVRNELISDMTFLECVMMDTFIGDNDTWLELRSLCSKIEKERSIFEKIELRIKRCNIFYDYLTVSYNVILSHAQRRSISANWLSDVFVENRDTLTVNLDKVYRSAYLHYKKK